MDDRYLGVWLGGGSLQGTIFSHSERYFVSPLNQANDTTPSMTTPDFPSTTLLWQELGEHGAVWVPEGMGADEALAELAKARSL